MAQPVLRVENLSKEYQLGTIGHGTLSKDLQSWWARVRGKEDPNARINQEQRKHGDRFWAIKDVSFELQQGERLGIIGRNGAGKSTLLKILSRVTTPTTGSVRIRGRVSSLLEVGTGFHPELTGRENVFLNGAILGMSRAEVTAKFDAIVDFAGVSDFIDTPVKRYSSGMYVRLAFAVAAHLDPEIMIVDEVLAVGDAEFQKKCIGKMENVSRDEGRTILFVSHNTDVVKSLCTMGLLLEDGRLTHMANARETVHVYEKRGKAFSQDRASVDFPEDATNPIQVVGASLQNVDREASKSFLSGESVILEIRYCVRIPISGISITVEVRCEDRAVFTTCDTDSSDVLETRQPGRYVTRIDIGKWLKPGVYSVTELGPNRMKMTDDNHSMTRDFIENVFQFEVIDDFAANRFTTYVASAPGIIRYVEPWSTTRTGDL